MADLPPHREDHHDFPLAGNAFLAGAPWGATAPPIPQRSLSRAAPPNHPGINLGYEAYDRPPPPPDLAAPHIYHDIGINNYTEVVPAQAQVIAPLAPEMQERDMFGHAAQHAPAGPAPGAFNAWPHEGPVRGGPVAEILRQLASLYLHHPGSQIGTFHVELDPAGGFSVTIALKIRVADHL